MTKASLKDDFVEKNSKGLRPENIMRYIRGERVRPSKLKEFKSVLPYLDVLKKAHEVREKAKELANKGDVKKALSEVRIYLSELKQENKLYTQRDKYNF